MSNDYNYYNEILDASKLTMVEIKPIRIDNCIINLTGIKFSRKFKSFEDFATERYGYYFPVECIERFFPNWTPDKKIPNMFYVNNEQNCIVIMEIDGQEQSIQLSELKELAKL